MCLRMEEGKDEKSLVFDCLAEPGTVYLCASSQVKQNILINLASLVENLVIWNPKHPNTEATRLRTCD